MSGTLDLPGGSIFCSALLLSVRCSAEARKDTIKVNHRRGTSQLWSSGLKRDQRMAPAKQRKGEANQPRQPEDHPLQPALVTNDAARDETSDILGNPQPPQADGDEHGAECHH